MGVNNFIAILVSILGLIIVIWAFSNEPKESSSISTKGSHVQLVIFGIGLVVLGLIYVVNN